MENEINDIVEGEEDMCDSTENSVETNSDDKEKEKDDEMTNEENGNENIKKKKKKKKKSKQRILKRRMNSYVAKVLAEAQSKWNREQYMYESYEMLRRYHYASVHAQHMSRYEAYYRNNNHWFPSNVNGNSEQFETRPMDNILVEVSKDEIQQTSAAKRKFSDTHSVSMIKKFKTNIKPIKFEKAKDDTTPILCPRESSKPPSASIANPPRNYEINNNTTTQRIAEEEDINSIIEKIKNEIKCEMDDEPNPPKN